MFSIITQRFRDMGRLKTLFGEAEALANAEGQSEPGAEHLVVAALLLPEDDSARRVFARFGAAPTNFQTAVERQYADALNKIGIESTPVSDQGFSATVSRKNGLYRAKESMRDLLDAVTDNKKLNPDAPFMAAEIILGATTMQFGVVARALAKMGLDRAELAAAARSEIQV
jgi:Clp amino terminal domain, pathogenicity island component